MLTISSATVVRSDSSASAGVVSILVAMPIAVDVAEALRSIHFRRVVDAALNVMQERLGERRNISVEVFLSIAALNPITGMIDQRQLEVATTRRYARLLPTWPGAAKI